MSFFKKRQTKLQEILKGKSFLTHDIQNICYLTGFKGSFGIYFQSELNRVLISDSRYKSQGETLAQNTDIKFKLYDKDFSKDFGEKLKGDALVETSLTLKQFESFKKQFPNLVLTPDVSPVEKLREIKDSEEIHLITHAQNHVDRVLFPFLKQQAKEGITEQELTYQLRIALEDNGQYEMSFPPIIAFGENSANPHYTPGNRKLKQGDNILIDCGVKYQGYCSDMTRNAFFGEPNQAFLESYNLLLTAQETAIKMSIAGTKISDIDQTSRDLLGNQNKFFTHSLGHGVGLDVHEEPGISGNNFEILEENQVITIEPGLYYPNKFGIRIEDLLLITNNSPTILSKTSKELLVL